MLRDKFSTLRHGRGSEIQNYAVGIMWPLSKIVLPDRRTDKGDAAPAIECNLTSKGIKACRCAMTIFIVSCAQKGYKADHLRKMGKWARQSYTEMGK